MRDGCQCPRTAAGAEIIDRDECFRGQFLHFGIDDVHGPGYHRQVQVPPDPRRAGSGDMPPARSSVAFVADSEPGRIERVIVRVALPPEPNIMSP